MFVHTRCITLITHWEEIKALILLLKGCKKQDRFAARVCPQPRASLSSQHILLHYSSRMTKPASLWVPSPHLTTPYQISTIAAPTPLPKRHQTWTHRGPICRPTGRSSESPELRLQRGGLVLIGDDSLRPREAQGDDRVGDLRSGASTAIGRKKCPQVTEQLLRSVL